MFSPSVGLKWLTAGLMVSGGIGSAQLIERGAATAGASESSARELRALSRRLAEPAMVTNEVKMSPVARPRRVVTSTAPHAEVAAAPKPVAIAPTTPTTPPVTPSPPAPASEAPKESPARNIALMGVTRMNNSEQAWLVDLSRDRREEAGEGDSIFGFRVKAIEDDSVVLTQGDQEFLVSLGEKEIPVHAASTGGGDPGPSFGGFGMGQGRGQGRGQGGFSGFGRGSDRNSRGFGSSGFGSGGFGGGSRFSSNGFGASGSDAGPSFDRSSSFGSGGFGGGSSGGGFSGRGQSFSGSGGFGGSGFSSRGMGSTGPGGSGSRVASNQGSRSTSNPQAARRSGQVLTGGEAIPDVAPLSNPQTQRRLGSGTGSAFGTAGSSGFGGGLSSGSAGNPGGFGR